MNIKKVFISYVPVVLAAVLLLVGLSYAAWNAPTAAPTGGNIDVPVNTGSGNQVKKGELGIGDSAVGEQLQWIKNIANDLRLEPVSNPGQGLKVGQDGKVLTTIHPQAGVNPAEEFMVATKDYVDSQVVAAGGCSSDYDLDGLADVVDPQDLIPNGNCNISGGGYCIVQPSTIQALDPANFVPNNIRFGTTILGVAGSLVPRGTDLGSCNTSTWDICTNPIGVIFNYPNGKCTGNDITGWFTIGGFPFDPSCPDPGRKLESCAKLCGLVASARCMQFNTNTSKCNCTDGNAAGGGFWEVASTGCND